LSKEKQRGSGVYELNNKPEQFSNGGVWFDERDGTYLEISGYGEDAGETFLKMQDWPGGSCLRQQLKIKKKNYARARVCWGK